MGPRVSLSPSQIIRPSSFLLRHPSVFLLFRGKDAPLQNIDIDKSFLRIRCPKCQWRPGRHDMWMCSPGCGYEWNTFDTHGLCPGCSKQWLDTECLRCNAMSPHDDWYERQP
jgi:hypothetical protein